MTSNWSVSLSQCIFKLKSAHPYLIELDTVVWMCNVRDIRLLFDLYCDIFNINTATDPESLAAYPHIRKLYISLNTHLPSIVQLLNDRFR